MSHELSRSPNAEPADPTLVEAVRRLKGDNHPVPHSDCGCRCRWPGWIGICSGYGIARSVSKRACSPDNAACEGFFGRLKNELFYHRPWDGMASEDFGRMPNGYVGHYNTQRRKKSLGWKSPEEYRLFLGYAA
ncbi:transposase [Olsenella profusa]|uniref:transposase n=1 Tax=Olsenella profusa TaxID=138595 RepID=UPI0035227EC5